MPQFELFRKPLLNFLLVTRRLAKQTKAERCFRNQQLTIICSSNLWRKLILNALLTRQSRRAYSFSSMYMTE